MNIFKKMMAWIKGLWSGRECVLCKKEKCWQGRSPICDECWGEKMKEVNR